MNSAPIRHDGAICLDLGHLVRAELIERVNRFRVRVRVGGSEASAYLANPGRLRELMTPGRGVWVKPAPGPNRKTLYDLALTEYADTLISLNSHLPNRLLEAALSARALSWFADYGTVRSEVTLGQSRLDFQLSDGCGGVCWLEAKSVTLVEGGVARFPDAPTKRGQRHMQELIDVASQGQHAAVVFVVQRADAERFSPHDQTDPEFGAALRAADRAGVEIRAVRCTVTSRHICLDRAIPVSLDGDTLAAIISAGADEH